MTNITTKIHIPETTPTGKFLNNDPTQPIYNMGDKTLCGQPVLMARVAGTPSCAACIALQKKKSK